MDIAVESDIAVVKTKKWNNQNLKKLIFQSLIVHAKLNVSKSSNTYIFLTHHIQSNSPPPPLHFPFIPPLFISYTGPHVFVFFCCVKNK